MADYRKRNNSGSNNNNDFNWEEYDRLTSAASSSGTRSRASASGSRAHSGNAGASGRSNTQQSAHRPRKQPPKRKRKKKQLTEKQRIFRQRLRLTLFAAAFICIVIISSISIGMYAAVSKEIKEMNIQNLALNTSSFIYYTDKFGEVKELEQISSETNSVWVESDQISQYMKDAIVSIEDERFYKHNGVDIKRTVGATGKFVLSKIGIGSASYGGSTITQQVIKNITKDTEHKASRKIKEMMRAIALERQLSKDEILTLYLNIAYFANNRNGVESAANLYFNKSASMLTAAEAASIAGITQYPSEYDPIANPQNNTKRRNTVLAKMKELGKLSEDEYQLAVTSDLTLDTSYVRKLSNITSYFADQVVSDVIDDLQTQKGYSLDFATQQVYNGGLKIYATIDTDVQAAIEDVFTDTNRFPYAGGKSQAAMLILDPYTGQVKGLVGGLGEKKDIRGWNRASQSKRQPGSSIKPLSVYGPAIDLAKITESSVVRDEEITIGNDKWKPKNSYDGFLGDITVIEAVSRSANIPAVKVLDEVGISNSFGYLQNKFHISTLDNGDKNYSSLALGGLTNGVTVRDMAGAYAVFANSGQYIEPHTYTQVVDSAGEIMLVNHETPSQSISAASAYIVSDLLYNVVNGYGGTGRGAQLDSGMPAYGKTGTTDDDCDKWFVGYTPYYVGAVWYGFDTPSSVSYYGVSGNPSVSAWKQVMDEIHESLPIKTFKQPSNVVEATVCVRSGMLATTTCNSANAYFVSGTQPKAYCNSSHATDMLNTATPIAPTITPTASEAPLPTSHVEPNGTSGTLGGDTTSGGGTPQGGTGGDTTSGGGTSQGGNEEPVIDEPIIDEPSDNGGGQSDFIDLGTVE